MRLLIVSGMLGSGKTSAILGLADILCDKGISIAILENEIGAVGIDGEILERSGMKVKELRGGCVCCSMKAGMVDALRTMEALVNPDLTIVEPTGIADPKQVIDAVNGISGLSISSIFTIIMVDAERFLKVRKMFERPLKNQLGVADLVLLNKVDTVSAADTEEIESHLRKMGYEGTIVRVQADKKINMKKAAELIR